MHDDVVAQNRPDAIDLDDSEIDPVAEFQSCNAFVGVSAAIWDGPDNLKVSSP